MSYEIYLKTCPKCGLQHHHSHVESGRCPFMTVREYGAVVDAGRAGRGDEVGRLRVLLHAVEAAYVTETTRAPGDYDPARRFRAHLPGGALAYGATREEAEAAFWAAVDRAKEGGGE